MNFYEFATGSPFLTFGMLLLVAQLIVRLFEIIFKKED